MGILDAPVNTRLITSTAQQGLVPLFSRARPLHCNTSPILSDGILEGSTFRQILTARATCYGLVFRYTNFYNVTGTETDGPNTIYVKASVELGGVLYPIYFRGTQTVAITPGTYVDSEPMGFDLALGATLPVRTYVTCAPGDKWPLGFTAITANNEGSNRANADLTIPGSGTVPVVADHMYGPSAVFGYLANPNTAIVGINGDSIAAGFSTTNETGFIEQALAGVYPFQSVAYPSDNPSHWGSTATRRRRIPFLDRCTHIICEQGVNAISAGLATLQGQLITTWTLHSARGRKVWQTTITPVTTSTDVWATTANQTVGANEAARTGVNDWIRAGAPMSAGVAVAIGTGGALLAGQAGHPLTGYFEIADLAETARNSGKWKSVGSGAALYTADGIHPTQAAHDAMQAGVTPLATFGLPVAT